MPKPDEVETDESWERMLEEAVQLAADDPDEFVVELKKLARELGMKAEDLYVKMQEREPRLRVHKLRNNVISTIAKEIKKRWGW